MTVNNDRIFIFGWVIHLNCRYSSRGGKKTTTSAIVVKLINKELMHRIQNEKTSSEYDINWVAHDLNVVSGLFHKPAEPWISPTAWHRSAPRESTSVKWPALCSTCLHEASQTNEQSHLTLLSCVLSILDCLPRRIIALKSLTTSGKEGSNMLLHLS